MTLTPAARASGATATAEVANSGPRISLAPSASAARAASRAPSGVPPVSRTTRVKRSPATSNSPSCAALSMARPTPA